MATVIEFSNVGKQYRLGLVSTRTLSHDLNRWWTVNILRRDDPYLKIGEENIRESKGVSQYIWALRDINLKVEQGDVVGIIGRNGAGKSTLLKLLSKVTGPTTGLIRAKGRIGALLEVGTGFHPEMTGRENIYMNGAILGMTRIEISRKLDEIVDFSGCERYLDTPVKRYSSGMIVRLGFAVAAHLDPEILVVDEVLAVGDAEFQKKAIGKMQDVSRSEGRTVLFVSHNMTSMRRLCRNGLLLENGRIKYTGNIEDTISHYMESESFQSSFTGVDGNPDIMFLSHAEIRSERQDGCFYVDQPIILNICFSIRQKVGSLVVGFNICNSLGHPIARNDYNDKDSLSSLPPGDYEMIFRIPAFTLAEGDYQVKFDIAEKNIKRYSTDSSNLAFTVRQGVTLFGNAFSEDVFTKKSVFKEDWMVSLKKL